MGLAGTVKTTPAEVCVPVRTMTRPVTAPLGTMTRKDVAVAAVTVAITGVLLLPAKVTLLSDAFVLKPSPIRVTSAPGSPCDGLTAETVKSSMSGKATTKVPRFVTSTEAVRPESSTTPTNSVCSYCCVCVFRINRGI